ncbi:MAG: hypothetical protein JO001_23460 [Alphaproteobacteria bacterium]|nr:hypothetical protein [Alphaproteobacteria bacterium]
MTILNFVTQEELDNLDEDPRMAFMALVNHAQRSLSHQLDQYDPDDERGWRQREEIQQRFMNVVVAAGKRFEIEPFASTVVPRHQDYRNSDYKQFESDLDHYVTQLVIDNSIRARKNSVEIFPDSKGKIRSYVHGLRTCIEQAKMHEAKRKALLDKLNQFERELEKARINILAVTLLTFEILGIPGTAWASWEVAQKLVTNITQIFAEAKLLEDQTRQIAPANSAPKALSPPRPSKSQPAPGDLDDEIPF